MIHHAVHTARPDIECVAHSHSIHGRAFCALGRNLDIITQDSCAFYDDIVLYSSFRGAVLEEGEGQAIAEALGDKKAALLQNHGLLACGKSIESTTFWFMSLEKCCQAQLMADAAAAGRGAETVKVSDEDAALTYKTVGTELAGWFSAKPCLRYDGARESVCCLIVTAPYEQIDGISRFLVGKYQRLTKPSLILLHFMRRRCILLNKRRDSQSRPHRTTYDSPQQ